MVVQVVACDSMDEALRAYRNADARADLVEFRLDRIPRRARMLRDDRPFKPH